MSIKLRKAVVADTARLVAMSQKFSKANGSALMPRAKHEARVVRELRSHTVDIILLDDEPVGYLVYLSQEDIEDGSSVLHLHRLFVEATHRRKGVGKEAIRQVLETFPGRTQVFLAVKPENKAAVAFYEALGFEVALLTMKRVL